MAGRQLRAGVAPGRLGSRVQVPLVKKGAVMGVTAPVVGEEMRLTSQPELDAGDDKR